MIDRDVATDHQTVYLININCILSIDFIPQNKMSSCQSKCNMDNIKAITNRECQCNIEDKTYRRNSSPFSCIKMYRFKYDKRALSHSAYWWWKTGHVTLAWGAMLNNYWRNEVAAVGMFGCLGEIFDMAGQSWCRLTGHRLPQSMQKSWPITCCRTRMPWAKRELLTSFCWTATANPTQRDWLWHTWPNKCN